MSHEHATEPLQRGAVAVPYCPTCHSIVRESNPEIVVQSARGRSIHVEVVGEPDGERVMKRHQHIFRFAGEVQKIDHIHEVMTNRDHVHRLSKTTSWSRFYVNDKEPA